MGECTGKRYGRAVVRRDRINFQEIHMPRSHFDAMCHVCLCKKKIVTKFEMKTSHQYVAISQTVINIMLVTFQIRPRLYKAFGKALCRTSHCFIQRRY